ncbi:MAG: D-alanyl-D-alanine carboxypeptidase DacA [Stenotrophomonas maltophilia]|uniref:D-alanyl-D-alanine carboxypeptidase DacA n=1 Tax=Stenotrophomonas maltophilia TaxID=40324 RepID=A0A7V8FG82_STEMA|nr:MAG: D-alanyl-D-alanine carboxypeptidase DacA [Stenotrophomonas maltophilia]
MITLDADGLGILFQHNATQVRPPASLTKLMTAYVAYAAVAAGSCRWDDRVQVDAADVDAVADDETRMGLAAGQQVPLQTLLEGMMVISGNDAALVLARHIAGSQHAFLQRMNDCAARMALHGTRFASVSGNTTPGHASTAHDMAVLGARLVVDFPHSLQVTAQRTFSFGTLHLQNKNGLLGEPGVDGLKTGYTQAAGHCLAATACRPVPGRSAPVRLITVVLGTASREQRHALALQYLEQGFATITAQAAASVA